METLLRIKDVLHKTGLSRSSLYEKIARRNFPEPIKLGLRSVAWLESEVNEWVLQCISATRTFSNYKKQLGENHDKK